MIFMRHFIYFSRNGPTSGGFDLGNLSKAGRLDIAIHSLIQGIFLSHDFRRDVVFHIVLYGMPDPPKHIEIQIKDDTPIKKTDIAKILKKILYKFREGEKYEVFPGCFVEKKSLLKLANELSEENEVFILDKKGDKLRETKLEENCAFILGDHEGLPRKELKRLKEIATPISVGPYMYFASQVVAVINNELDNL